MLQTNIVYGSKKTVYYTRNISICDERCLDAIHAVKTMGKIYFPNIVILCYFKFELKILLLLYVSVINGYQTLSFNYL